MSDSSRGGYIWIAILGLILSVIGVMLNFGSVYWESVGTNLYRLGFAVLLFSIALLLYSKE